MCSVSDDEQFGYVVAIRLVRHGAGASVWDTGKRPPCTRLKDLDSAGMEKLTSFCAMSGFPRRQLKYQDFNNVHTAGLDGEKSKEGKEKKKKKKERKNFPKKDHYM